MASWLKGCYKSDRDLFILSIIAVVGLVFTGMFHFKQSYVPPKPLTPIYLQGFRFNATKQSLDINLSDGTFSVVSFAFKEQPSSIGSLLQNALKPEELAQKVNTDPLGHVSLELPEISSQPVRLLVFLKCLPQCKVNAYAELLYRKETFALGRHSIVLPTAHAAPQSWSIQSSQASSLPKLSPWEVKERHLTKTGLQDIASLMRFIWSEPFFTDSTQHTETPDLNPTIRLEQLREGDIAFTSSHLTSIFMGFASALPGVSKAREVSLLQFWPSWPQLTPIRHTLAEVYLKAHKQWAAIDPRYAVIYRHKGKLLSIEGIATLAQSGSSQEIEALSLLGEPLPHHPPQVLEATPLKEQFFQLFQNLHKPSQGLDQ